MALPLTFAAASPYLAAAELRNFYGQAEIDQLADRDSDNAADPAPQWSVVDAAIERAAAELDSYLAKCYPLPLAPAAGFTAVQGHVAWLLAEWTGVIARYRLWDDVRLRASGEQKTEARLRYEDLLKKLGGLDPCAKCGCELLGPSVLTNLQAGLAVVDMPEVASNGTVWQRTDWDFAGSAPDARRHSGRAYNDLQ